MFHMVDEDMEKGIKVGILPNPLPQIICIPTNKQANLSIIYIFIFDNFKGII